MGETDIPAHGRLEDDSRIELEDAAAAGKVLWSQDLGPDFTGLNRNPTDRSGMRSVPVATIRAIGDVLSSSSSSLVMLAHYYFTSARR